MITLRQNCINCSTTIDYKTVNTDTGIYACTHCDTVSSIYEDRKFREVSDIQKPPDVEVHTLGNSLYIDFVLKGVVHVSKAVGYLLLSYSVFSIFMLFFNSKAGLILFGVLMVTFIILGILNKGQKTRIEVTPYTIEVYGLKDGKRNDVTLANVPTFMIDQVYVHKYEKVDTDSETGSVTRRYYVYELNAWMKDMCEENLLMPIKEKDTYEYIEKVIEAHLGITNREMSRGE